MQHYSVDESNLLFSVLQIQMMCKAGIELGLSQPVRIRKPLHKRDGRQMNLHSITIKFREVKDNLLRHSYAPELLEIFQNVICYH